MRTSSILVSILAVVMQITAQTLLQNDNVKLVISSKNETVDGAILSACHQHVTTQGLCLAGSNGTTLTYSHSTKDNGVDYGILQYNFTWTSDTGRQSVLQPMSFQYRDTTNVALVLFNFGYSYIPVTIRENKLELVGRWTNPSQTLFGDKWHLCEAGLFKYRYNSLVWVIGKSPPQDASCQKVEVVVRMV